MITLLQVILILVGLYLLLKGAGWFVDGASGIAEYFHISPLVIGLTIMAIGTSAPETAVSIMSAIKGNDSIAVGNILGSNIANILLILGISGLIGTLTVKKNTVFSELLIMLLATGCFAYMGWKDGELSFREGVCLLVFFAGYFVYVIIRATITGKNQKKDIQEMTEKSTLAKVHEGVGMVGEKKEQSFLRHFVLTILGLGVVFGSSELIVEAAEIMAKDMGLPNRLIALTIVALSTSLPELFTSVVAARKGHAELVVGNILGSNLFNILFVTGVMSVCTPIKVEMAFVTDLVVALGAGALLFVCLLPKKRLNPMSGVILLGCYVAYIIVRSAG